MTAHAGLLPLPVAAARAGRLGPAAFVALAFAASWSCVGLLGPSVPGIALALWIPGLLAIALTRATGGRVTSRLGLDRLGWADAYLVAYWLPVIFATGLIALTVLCGLGRLDAGLGGDDVASEIAGALTIAPLVNALVMLGPELGWRAYLLRHLLPFGTWRAIAATSVLWWAWQAPLVQGPMALPWTPDGASAAAWCVLVGAILGWLYVRTRSAWAPALFAGAIGATSSLPGLVLRDVAAGAAGPVSPLALVLPALAVLLLWRSPIPANAD